MPNEAVKLTVLGGGWLAPLACRTISGAPQLNSGALDGTRAMSTAHARRRRPSYECAYCGRVRPATDDHVPAKCLFSPPLPSSLPTVKSCDSCNRDASQDDEYFRDVVLKYHRVAEQPEAQPLLDKMFRAAALPAKRRYTAAVLRSLTEVEVTTDAGINLGRQPAYRVDRKRVARAAERYVRGLHRHELGYRVPDGLEVRIRAEPESVHRAGEAILRFMRGRPVRIVQPDVFHYVWVHAVDRPEASIWALVFFNEFPILGFIRPPRLSRAV